MNIINTSKLKKSRCGNLYNLFLEPEFINRTGFYIKLFCLTLCNGIVCVSNRLFLHLNSIRQLKVLVLTISLFLCQGAAFTVDSAKNAVWHNERGLFFLDLNYHVAAIKEFQLAIMLNPESEVSATFYNNLGRSYYKIKDYDSAESAFKKAVKLKPYYLKFRENLIKAYKQKNILNEVVRKHNKLIAQDKNNLQSYIMLGLIYKSRGNNEFAVMYLKKFVMLAPEFEVTRQIKQIIEELKE